MANAMKMFKSVAMCAPNHFKVAYKINPWMGGTVDSALAHKQWNTLKNAFEKNGVEVKTINQAEGLPDMVFCCNSGIVYGKKVNSMSVYIFINAHTHVVDEINNQHAVFA